MYVNKAKTEMDYSTFKTEVSKRRRAATTRELSKKISLTNAVAVTIESIEKKRATCSRVILQ